jgi:hypothetical protein
MAPRLILIIMQQRNSSLNRLQSAGHEIILTNTMNLNATAVTDMGEFFFIT